MKATTLALVFLIFSGIIMMYCGYNIYNSTLAITVLSAFYPLKSLLESVSLMVAISGGGTFVSGIISLYLTKARDIP